MSNISPSVVYVYGLVDPRTGLIRYVGKTKDPKDRIGSHLTEARHVGCPRTYKNYWVRRLLAEGLRPGMLLLCRCDSDGCAEEVAIIAEFRARGFRLTNGTCGGDGVVNPTPAALARLSAALRANPANAEKSRQSIKFAHAANRGKHRSEETKAKISAFHRQRIRTPEELRSLRAAGILRRGIRNESAAIFTLEQEAEICRDYESGLSQVQVGVKWSIRQAFVSLVLKRHKIKIRPNAPLTPEQVARMAAGKRGKKQSPEQIATRFKARAEAQIERDKIVLATYRELGCKMKKAATALGIDRGTIVNALKREKNPSAWLAPHVVAQASVQSEADPIPL